MSTLHNYMDMHPQLQTGVGLVINEEQSNVLAADWTFLYSIQQCQSYEKNIVFKIECQLFKLRRKEGTIKIF